MQNLHPEDASQGSKPALSGVVNLIGAACSLALVIGVSVWGYQSLTRDVSGVPVVRASDGPARVQPEDPGGSQALYQGLAVNDVAAQGTASKPADRLILAPKPLDLSLSDAPVVRAENEETQGTLNDDAARLASVAALAESLAEGVAPISNEEVTTQVETETAAALADTPRVEGGLGRSLRPQLRPASLTLASAEDAENITVGINDIDPDTLPVGTRLAQLGAFASREIAEQEWGKLSDRFDQYLEGKGRVIQKASSGGRTFYRLRAHGFEDLNDARRFCSALVAERAECIPVITR